MTKEEIGDYLKRKRDCSKSEFSLKSGLGRPQIDAIENGKGYTIDSLQKYCKYVGAEVVVKDKQIKVK